MPEELKSRIGLFIAHYHNYRQPESLETLLRLMSFMVGRQILDQRKRQKGKQYKSDVRSFEDVIDTLSKQAYITVQKQTIS